MQENDVHYKYLFEKSGVSIWNEDLSEVVLELERLRTKGVTDIRKYLHTNPKVVFKFLEKVKVLEVNNATLQLFEAHDKESFLESIDKCFGENAIDVFIDELEAIWERREAFRSDANFITTTGKNITCQVSFQIPEIIDEFRYLPVTLVDITETIIAKGALRDSLQKFEAIRKCSIPMLFMYDSDGLITLSEGKMLAAVGLEPGQLAGQNVFEVYADYPDVVTALKKPFSGEPYEGYIELDELVFEVFYSPYFDTQGNVSNVLGMAMDITKRKKLEDTLSKNEERFRKLFDDTDAISIQGYDHNQIVTYWNRASEQLYGYSAQQAIGESLYDLIIPRAMHEQARRDIHNWIENDIPIPAESLTLQRADGSPINVYSSHVFLRDDNDQPEMFCIDIDLTAQVEAQKALNASEEKYRLLVENANEGILVIQHGLFKYSNSAASNLFGATPEHLLDTAFIDYVHSDDRTIVA
ncbi:MAG: PAS domain S-box protein, partial [Gammaproteobacteria bacterium]|nr:PAS domain S-box protein [Gammaproteobacteria bacterium]